MMRYQSASDKKDSISGKSGNRREDLPSLLTIRLPFTMMETFVGSLANSLDPTIDGAPLDIKHVMTALFSTPTLRHDGSKEVRQNPTAMLKFPFEFYRSEETKRAKAYLDELLSTKQAPESLFDLRVPLKGNTDHDCTDPFKSENEPSFIIKASLFLSYPMVSEDNVSTPFAKIPRHPMHSLPRLLNTISEDTIRSTPPLVLAETLKQRIKAVALILGDWSRKPDLAGPPPEFQSRYYEFDANRRDFNALFELLVKSHFDDAQQEAQNSWWNQGWTGWSGWRGGSYSSSSSYDTGVTYGRGRGKGYSRGYGKGSGKGRGTWVPRSPKEWQ